MAKIRRLEKVARPQERAVIGRECEQAPPHALIRADDRREMGGRVQHGFAG